MSCIIIISRFPEFRISGRHKLRKHRTNHSPRETMASHGSSVVMTGVGPLCASPSSTVVTPSVSEFIQYLEGDMDKYMSLMGRVIPRLNLQQHNVMCIVDGVRIPWTHWTGYYFAHHATPWEELVFVTELENLYGIGCRQHLRCMKKERVSVPSARTQDAPPVPQSSASANDDLWAWVDNNILHGAPMSSSSEVLRLESYLRRDLESYIALVEDAVFIRLFGTLHPDIASSFSVIASWMCTPDTWRLKLYERIKYAYHDRKVHATLTAPSSSASANDDLWAWVDYNILHGAPRGGEAEKDLLHSYLRSDPESYVALVDSVAMKDLLSELRHDIASSIVIIKTLHSFTDTSRNKLYGAIKYAYHDRILRELHRTDDIQVAPSSPKSVSAPRPPVRISGEDVETDIERLECAVCKENEKVVMVTPCNHMCFCIGCANAAIDKGISDAKCPVCRGDVKEFVKVFS